MANRTFASIPQPSPQSSKANVLPVVTGNLMDLWYRGGHETIPYLIADLEERADFGFKKYGVPLQAYNGRDAICDAHQEALDLLMYLGQARIEYGVNLPVEIYDQALALAMSLRQLIIERDS